jgi:hypothetical protein
MMMSWADIGEDLLGLIDDRLGQRDVASHGLSVDRVAERDRLPDREVILDADLSGIPAARDRLSDRINSATATFTKFVRMVCATAISLCTDIVRFELPPVIVSVR